MKKALFIIIVSFMAAIPLRAGLYDELHNLPSSILETNFPHIANKPNLEIQWHHVLNVEPTATDDEIAKAYKKLYLKFHPDKNTANYAKTVSQLLGDAKAKKSDVVVIDRDGELPWSKILFKLLPKKIIASATIPPVIAYTLYKGAQTDWFKNKMHYTADQLKQKSPKFYAALKKVAPISIIGKGAINTTKFAIDLVKIGSGISLVILSLPLGWIGYSCLVAKDKSQEIGNVQLKLPQGNFYLSEDGKNYVGTISAFTEQGLQQVQITYEKETLRQQLQQEYQQAQQGRIAYPIFSSSFMIAGITAIKSGFDDLKDLFSSSEQKKDSLIVE